MDMWNLLFGSWGGILSAAVIAFMLGMGVFFAWYIKTHD